MSACASVLQPAWGRVRRALLAKDGDGLTHEERAFYLGER